MAILNGSYKFHTSPTNYQDSSFSYQVNYTDNAGTEYKEISFSPGFFTAGRKLNDSSRVTFFDTVQPINDDLYDLFTFDDIDACPWIILTFNNQQVDNLLYEIITNCAAPYLDGILIKITSPNGITLATEKTIVNSNIKVTIDESLLGGGVSGYPVEVTDSSIIINSTETGKIYKYIGNTDEYCTNGCYYVVTEE